MEILLLITYHLNMLTECYRDKVFPLKYVFCNQGIFSNSFLYPINFQIQSCAISNAIISK